MIELVEFTTPLIIDGEVQWDEDDNVVLETRQGVILHWGIQPIKIDDTVSQTTVVFIRETESGKVVSMNPEEITFL